MPTQVAARRPVRGKMYLAGLAEQPVFQKQQPQSPTVAIALQ
jgi:hypothetical protein